MSAGYCATCRVRLRIADSPVVEGICAWGHIAPEAYLAPRPGQDALTKMEAARLLEAIGAAGDITSDAAYDAEYRLNRGDPEAIPQLRALGGMWDELRELRADLRHVFERAFFAVTL